MSAPDRQRDVMERMLQDLNTQTRGLERDVAKLKVDRDQALAELEEISKANKYVGAAWD